MGIKFDHLNKTFSGSKTVLDDLTFELPSKKFSGLLGPSGCGKTTLLRILAGLEHATSGRIEIEGEIWSDRFTGVDVRPEKRNVGMVFQSYAIWPHMSVGDNIGFPLRVRQIPKAARLVQVRTHLKAVGLEGFEDRFPDSLSGGQQQRVALARALIQKPNLLLLDEPLSNLDANLRGEMRAEIRRIQKEFAISSVIVTHDWADAEALCDHIVVLNQGKIEQAGSPAELKQNPASAFVKSLIRAH